MSATLRSFYAALIAFFSALEKLGNTLNNLGTIAEETSGQAVDEARITRQIQMNKLNADLKASAVQALPAPAP